jgi:hypothetical protein
MRSYAVICKINWEVIGEVYAATYNQALTLARNKFYWTEVAVALDCPDSLTLDAA